jgi:hypothetical protein
MRVDIGRDHFRNPCELNSDKPGAGTYFKNTVTGLHLRPCCIEQKIRVGIGYVDLGRIVRHEITLVI